MMPAVFIGHGSPMNAIDDNNFTKEWAALGEKMLRPEAVLVVSAHWYTGGTKVLDSVSPKMTYDMYGFPNELYQVVYDAPGAPELAHRVRSLLGEDITHIDNNWGFDHGNWSVLTHMYPNRDVPVTQLSIDYNMPPKWHFETGRKLKALRNEGVLILGSGNIVHNLRKIDWNMQNGYSWAYTFDKNIKNAVLEGDFEGVMNYPTFECTSDAVPTPDHFYPFLYVLGASGENESKAVFNDALVLGSISMTCYAFGI